MIDECQISAFVILNLYFHSSMDIDGRHRQAISLSRVVVLVEAGQSYSKGAGDIELLCARCVL